MSEDAKATTCVLFDVDAMQAFNDGHGWEAGNKLLEEIMSVLARCFPAANEVIRLSGDEFLVATTETAIELSAKVARDASEEICNSLGVSVAFGIGSGGSIADAKRVATLALFELRARQRH